jgi:GNAT superfamily N-acetyltransferase
MDHHDLVRRAARNLAAWHDCSVRALGRPTSASERWWTAALPVPAIYHCAISLDQGSNHPEMLTELRAHLARTGYDSVSVCDSFASLDLRALGLERAGTAPWYARPAGAVAWLLEPSGLEIRRVVEPADLMVFEQALVTAFSAPIPLVPFAIHAPTILDDPAMHLLAGWCAGRVAVVAMAYEAAGVLGVYGVGTIPRFRRRGFARAITAAAVTVNPSIPAILQPTKMAAPLYRALGFAPIGMYALWR